MSKSMIGLDPLAWLSPEAVTTKSKKKKTKSKAKKKAAKKASTNSKAKKKAVSKKKVVSNKKVSAKKKISTKKKTTAKKKIDIKESAIKIIDEPKIEVQDVTEEIHSSDGIAADTEGKKTDNIVAEIEPNNTESEGINVTDSTIKLAEVQDISQVEELHGKVSKLINTTDIVFDGAEVERIDASSLQLISCAFKQAEKYGNKVSWNGSSDALKQSAKLLGLTDIIGL